METLNWKLQLSSHRGSMFADSFRDASRLPAVQSDQAPILLLAPRQIRRSLRRMNLARQLFSGIRGIPENKPSKVARRQLREMPLEMSVAHPPRPALEN